MTRHVTCSSRSEEVDMACEGLDKTVCVIDARTLCFSMADDTAAHSPSALYAYRASQACLRDDVLRAARHTQGGTTAAHAAEQTAHGCATCGLTSRNAVVAAAAASGVSLALLAACTQHTKVEHDDDDATAEPVAARAVCIETSSSSLSSSTAKTHSAHVWLVFACGCCAMARFLLHRDAAIAQDTREMRAPTRDDATRCGLAELQDAQWFAVRHCARMAHDAQAENDSTDEEEGEMVALLPRDVPLSVCLTRRNAQPRCRVLRVALAHGRRHVLYAELCHEDLASTHDEAAQPASRHEEKASAVWSLRAVGLVPVQLHADGSYRAQGVCRALQHLRWLVHSWDYNSVQHPLLAMLYSHAAMPGDPPLDHVTLAMLQERRCPRVQLTDKAREDKAVQCTAASTMADVQCVDAAFVDGPWSVRQLTLALPRFLFCSAVLQGARHAPDAHTRRAKSCYAAPDMDSVLGVFLRPPCMPYWPSQLLRQHAAQVCAQLTDKTEKDKAAVCAPHDFAFVLYTGEGELCRCAVDGYVEWAVQLPRRDSTSGNADAQDNRADVCLGAVLAMLSSGDVVLLQLHRQRATPSAGSAATQRRCGFVVRSMRVSCAAYGTAAAVRSADNKTGTPPMYCSAELTDCLAVWLRDEAQDEASDGSAPAAAAPDGCMLVRRTAQHDAAGLQTDVVLLPFYCTAAEGNVATASHGTAVVFALPHSQRRVCSADLLQHTMQSCVPCMDDAFATASRPSSSLELLVCAALPRCSSCGSAEADTATHVGLLRSGRICTWSTHRSSSSSSAVHVRSQVQWPAAHAKKVQGEYDDFVCRALVRLFGTAQAALVLLQPLWQPADHTVCSSPDQPASLLVVVVVVGSVWLAIAADGGAVLHATTVSPLPLLPLQLAHVYLSDVMGKDVTEKSSCWCLLSGLQLHRVCDEGTEGDETDHTDQTASPWQTALSADAVLTDTIRTTSYVCALELSWLTFGDLVAAHVRLPAEREALMSLSRQSEWDCAAQLLLRVSHVLLAKDAACDGALDGAASSAAGQATEDKSRCLDGMPFFCTQRCLRHPRETAMDVAGTAQDTACCEVLVAAYDRIVRLHCPLSPSPAHSDTSQAAATTSHGADAETWLLMRDVMAAVQSGRDGPAPRPCQLQYVAAVAPCHRDRPASACTQSDVLLRLLLVTVSFALDAESEAARHSYLLAQPHSAGGEGVIHAYPLTVDMLGEGAASGASAAMLALECAANEEGAGSTRTSAFLARTEDGLPCMLRVRWAALLAAMTERAAAAEKVVVHRGGMAEASSWLTVTPLV